LEERVKLKSKKKSLTNFTGPNQNQRSANPW
jgi:hypothetical protein